MKVNFINLLTLSIFILYISQTQQFSLFSVPEIDPMALLSCDELYSVIFTSYENITEYIDQNIYYLKQKFPICIDLLVKNGRIEALDYYLDELDKRKLDYRTSLKLAINSIKKELEDVNIKYRYQKIEYKNIYPASQWAQSLDNIYVEIKFAHRHDSPGCLEVEDRKIDIKEDSLSFTGTCSLGDDYIRIDYSIKLHKKINVAASVHESGAVGRYRFTLKKAERGFWEKLLADGEEPHSNMKIWYEMKEKYQDELMGYEKDEDDENDKDDKDGKSKDDDDNDESDNKENEKDDKKDEKKEEPKKEETKKEETKKEEKKKEEPKKEEPKKEEKKKEEPKKEETKKEETKKEETKKEEKKKEEPKKEEPMKEEKKKEELKKEEPKKEGKKKEEPKKEEPKKEEKKKEEPKKEEPKKEEKKKEELKKEEPKKEEKKKEELKKEEPKKEGKKKEDPKKEEPKAEEKKKEESKKEEPKAEEKKKEEPKKGEKK